MSAQRAGGGCSTPAPVGEARRGSVFGQALGVDPHAPALARLTQCERAPTKVHLVQMDLAVVDTRSPTRWMYTTLAYNGKSQGKTEWERLEPIGVQWGSDPGTFPAVKKEDSKPARESITAPVGVPHTTTAARSGWPGSSISRTRAAFPVT